jgi:uncharacterized integral membrane protein (TIGR00697 family)
LANIQILHLTKYAVFKEPMPLGTVLFTTIFFASGLITEKYGAAIARKSIVLSLFTYGFFCLSMVFSMMHNVAVGEGVFLQQMGENYEAMRKIFLPSVRLLIASMTAFFVSNFINIKMFNLKNFLKNKSFQEYFPTFSVFISSIADHLVFTLLAFYFFVEKKPDSSLFWGGYVIQSYVLRCITICIGSLFFKFSIGQAFSVRGKKNNEIPGSR